MEQKPVPKGRGALLEMLKKHKEARSAGGAGEPVEEQVPPKTRGRAMLLQKIQAMKERKAGDSPEFERLASTPGPSSVSSESKRGVAGLSKEMSEMSVTASETCSYRGEVGTPIKATANYIFLNVDEDRGVFEYEVRFQPDIDAKSNRIKLVNEALGELRTTKVYDGDVCLYLPVRVISDKQQFESVIPNTNNPVTTILIYKRKRKLSECLHLYNVLFKRIMHLLLYHRMGRNYFSPEHKYLVPQHKLEVLPGFCVHVDEMEGGLMLCLDTQHRVIRSQTVYELFHEIRAANPRNFREEVTKNVIGACVLTKYNNKTYIIDDIAWNMNPKDTFESKNKTQNSFIDYYKEHHNITIEDVDQPLLINRQVRQVQDSKVEHMVCLIPELCYLTGLTDVMRNDFKVMKDVAAFTRITPNQRMLALRTYLDRVRQSEPAQKVLSGWGLSLADDTLELQARVLPQEAVYFGGPDPEARKYTGGSDWNKAMADNKLTGPVNITNWQLYYTRRDQKYAANFAQTIVRLSKGMGCIIGDPHHIVLDDDRSETYMTSIRDNVQNTQVAVFICPTLRADRYSIIKKMCCVNIPVASQVILSKTLSNPQKVRTIIHKIAMQITCKLGGTLWSVKIPVSGWMVCGIDVYHGANNQSVCGFVGSINGSLTKYYSKAMFQDGEIGDFFKMPFRKMLQEKKDKEGSFPSKVIVFRDGLGDGQLEHCKKYEVSQLQEVIKELNIDTTITFVVVQKRINTRIFRMVNETTFDNPPSGTVVDTMVTRRQFYDFFLVPQSVRQGTVNPTHYVVLLDEGNIKPDHLQRLAYKLCHLYYNWSGTIRVPAPCLYAHKLAALVGQYIKKTPSTVLDDKLFYL
ncbi:piwi-like protein Ago3 [Tribolium madens]|uniref:piwi-like protein Ago3 n=1 Tax=Tribolium madens TaxID=41895 RepID=UPI001CF727EA|nr:piwi-like protein Ago3 [Tribolium madens]XP_044254278.1 piwi-like protein Ago3 [Tribolium madens]